MTAPVKTLMVMCASAEKLEAKGRASEAWSSLEAGPEELSIYNKRRNSATRQGGGFGAVGWPLSELRDSRWYFKGEARKFVASSIGLSVAWMSHTINRDGIWTRNLLVTIQSGNVIYGSHHSLSPNLQEQGMAREGSIASSLSTQWRIRVPGETRC